MVESTTLSAGQRLPEELRSHYIDVESMPWQKTDINGIDMRVLYSDPDSGRSTIIFKMQPGAVVPLHEHTALEQTYVLSGSLTDDEGTVTEGNFVWRPAGNTHVAHAPGGALIISFFLKPNRFMAGEKFFTE